MRTELLLQYSLEILLAVSLFYLGKLMILKGRDIARKMKTSSSTEVDSFFSDFGRVCQLAAIVWGGLEAVSVLMVV